MESYIHLYETNSEFTEAYNSPNYKEPWLSLTEEGMKVNYNKPKLTAITFGNITWVTDIPAKGGTATKDNCEFKVYGNYEDGTSADISSDAIVTGELVVPSSTEEQRHEAGQLTLTASYSGFTATGSITAYQAAVDFSTKPLTFNILSAGTVNWTAFYASASRTIEYKLNNGNWASIKSNNKGVKIEVNAGDKIQFRGNNATYGTASYYSSAFGSSTAEFEVEGNIMSLINPTDFSTLTTLESTNTFYNLFNNCTGLTSAENLVLPATTLANGCYYQMFWNCTSLKTAPALPATTLKSECYSNMFQNCTSLTTAPALPATTLADYCYKDMFWNCTSLTTAPELPARTLAEHCYQSMFKGCTSLTTAPELPAMTLTIGCYQYMFQGCTILNYIKCLATSISVSTCTDTWVDGVASTGTFVKAADMTGWTTGVSGIPTGWTAQNAS